MSNPTRDLQRDAEAAALLRVALGDVIEHDDDPWWAEALEGQTDFYETLERVVDAIHRDETDASACKAREAAHKSRRLRLEYRAERGRSALKDALSKAGLSKARTSLATLSLCRNQRVDIVNSDRLPSWALRQRAPEPDKDAIGKRLKAGEEVPGAELTETQGVRISWT